MHSQPALKGLCERLSGVRCVWSLKQPHNRNKRSTLIPTVCCFKGQCTPFCEFRLTAGCGADQKKNGHGGGRVLFLLCPPPTVTAADLFWPCIFSSHFLTAGIVSSRALKPIQCRSVSVPLLDPRSGLPVCGWHPHTMCCLHGEDSFRNPGGSTPPN